MTQINTLISLPTVFGIHGRLGRASFTALLAVLITGCAGTVDKTATSVDLTKESIVVMSMRMTNEIAPTFKPSYVGFELEEQGATLQNLSSTSAAASASGASAVPTVRAGVYVDRGAPQTLVVVRARPGKYSIQRLVGRVGTGLVVGDFLFEVDAPVDVPPASVVYLGHLDLVNQRKAHPEDQSSGLVVPVISQAAAGLAQGTLKVTLADNYESDVGELKSQYPAMKSLPVVRAPLQSMQLRRAMGSKLPALLIKQNPTL